MFSTQPTHVNHDDMLSLINAHDILTMAQKELNFFIEKQAVDNPHSDVIGSILDLSMQLDGLVNKAMLQVQHAILMNDYLRECNHD